MIVASAFRRKSVLAGAALVWIAGAILEAAVRMPLFEQKMLDEIARVTERLRRQPRDLQHFEPQTHDTIL